MLRRDLMRSLGFATLSLLGCTSKKEVEVMYPGSLIREMEEFVIPSFEKKYGCDVISEAKGSLTIIQELKDGLRRPDVVISSDSSLLDELKFSLIDQYYLFASNSIVVAGKKEVPENWIERIVEREVKAGMSDPGADPLGYRTLIMLKLAEIYYGFEFYKRVVENLVVFALETDLSANLSAGNIDVGFLYKNMALNYNLNFIELPDEINLSNPEMDEFYSKAEVRVGKRTFRGRSIAYGIAEIKGGRGKEFVDFMLNDGLKILRKLGFRTFTI